jgi:very-short-patch-repair endonuclease
MAKVSVKSMSPEERREWMREIGRRGAVKGGKARAKQFTSSSQRHARKRLSSEKAAANGKKGAQRTIELHGYQALFEGCRRKRLANPSKTELVMMGLLKTLRMRFEREYVLGETLFTLDFYLAEYALGIEVDGSIHDPGKPDQAKRIQHAERKEALCRVMKIKLIRIHHTELADDDLSAVINKIREIAGMGCAGKQSHHRSGVTGEPPAYETADQAAGSLTF